MNSKFLYLYNLIKFVLPETGLFAFKSYFLNFLGAKIGRNVRVCSSVKIIGNGRLTIGDNVWIGLDVMIVASGGGSIYIDENVDVGPKVFLGTGTHEVCLNKDRIAGKGISKDISIGKGTWIGAGSIILPGVTVGSMCMIAAGSVVTKDVPNFTMVGGVPAKKIRDLGNV